MQTLALCVSTRVDLNVTIRVCHLVSIRVYVVVDFVIRICHHVSIRVHMVVDFITGVEQLQTYSTMIRIEVEESYDVIIMWICV